MEELGAIYTFYTDGTVHYMGGSGGTQKNGYNRWYYDTSGALVIEYIDVESLFIRSENSLSDFYITLYNESGTRGIALERMD